MKPRKQTFPLRATLALHGVTFTQLSEWTGRTRGWLSRVGNGHDDLSETLAADIIVAFRRNLGVSLSRKHLWP